MTVIAFEISIMVEAKTEEEAIEWLEKHGDFDISNVEEVTDD